jgi:sec-independent protein translocase protein TatA
VFGFGWMELLLVLVIVLVVFGAGKLPQLGEGLGKAIKGFKKSVHEPEPQLEAQAVSVQGLPASAGVAMAAPGQQDAGKAPSRT